VDRVYSTEHTIFLITSYEAAVGAHAVRPPGKKISIKSGAMKPMEQKILLGRDQKIIEIPRTIWEQHLAQIPGHSQSRLNFMTEAHHQVRYFTVKEMAIRQKPIEPEFIANELNLPLDQLQAILEELEQRLFFLVRNEQGAVAWAYPVTVETTPHKLNFSSGERLYAA
jgi:hypothetical protein